MCLYRLEMGEKGSGFTQSRLRASHVAVPFAYYPILPSAKAKDALGTRARDELDLSSSSRARPVQAAFASAASFTVGAAMPLAAAFLAPAGSIILAVAVGSLLFLAVLGALGGYAGRAGIGRGTIRVTAWGAFAMATTAGLGRSPCAPFCVCAVLRVRSCRCCRQSDPRATAS